MIKTSLHRISTTFFTALLMAASFNATATSLKIHVLDADKSQPLRNASVCLGTNADLGQFGAMRTDENGDVMFSHPPKAPVLLTVSASQRKGIQRIVPLRNVDINLVRIVSLPRGGLGPVCDAPAIKIPYTPDTNTSHNYNLRIAGVYLDRGQNNTDNRTVVLSSTIHGKPTHYRISEDPEFKDSKWQDYQKTPLYTLSDGQGHKKVYYQVRKSIDMEGGSIQTTSNIMSDWITLGSR